MKYYVVINYYSPSEYGDEMSWNVEKVFTDKEEANKYADEKNKRMPSKYMQIDKYEVVEVNDAN